MVVVDETGLHNARRCSCYDVEDEDQEHIHSHQRRTTNRNLGIRKTDVNEELELNRIKYFRLKMAGKIKENKRLRQSEKLRIRHRLVMVVGGGPVVL